MSDRSAGLLETTGSLDVVEFDNDTVAIAGWSAAFDGSPVDGFVVQWRGEPLTILEIETGLPSADVTEVYPQLPLGGACRFRLVARAPERRGDLLIQVVPTTGGRRGRRLFRLIDPALPEPPEEHARAVGGGSFVNIGLEMLDYLIELGRLRPEERVLDVGCGVGRIAYGLAYYLNDRGQYDGFDVMPSLVEWAAANIGRKRPNFRFRHVNIYNSMYNPGGVLHADTLTFPYHDATFDVVTVISVFTHISSREVRHYLDEIARVLAPGGRVVATAFVMTDEVRSLICQGRSTLSISHSYRGGYVADRCTPEAAVGFDEPALRHWIEDSGLRVASLFPGSWCGRARGLSYQDLLVLDAGNAAQQKPRSTFGTGRLWRLLRPSR
jgi:SAM-dependent methyltransferase